MVEADKVVVTPNFHLFDFRNQFIVSKTFSNVESFDLCFVFGYVVFHKIVSSAESWQCDFQMPFLYHVICQFCWVKRSVCQSMQFLILSDARS